MQTSEPNSSSASIESGRWPSQTHLWFWSLIVIGAAIRIYFIGFTQGTYDVGIWSLHAGGVSELGLFNYYHLNANANHPPLILGLESYLWRAAEFSGIPFRIFLRAPFAFFDAGTTLLLFILLRTHPWRRALTAAYWINPVSLILSAYQGNTDPMVAFFILLAIWLLSRGRIGGAALAVAAGLWIKLPGLLAVPALVFYLQGWRRRVFFLSAVGILAAIGYLPALIHDASVLWVNVFGYHGRLLQTSAGIPAWGPRVLLFSVIAPAEKWPEQSHAPILFYLQHSWQIAVSLSLVLSWLRRSFNSVPQFCATIAMVYLTVYGLTDFWSFQYLSWSLPFWFFLPLWGLVPLVLSASAYLYGLYSYLCGNLWLRGIWDFAGHPDWPPIVILLRNQAVLLFFVAACVALGAALWQQFANRADRVSTAGDQPPPQTIR